MVFGVPENLNDRSIIVQPGMGEHKFIDGIPRVQKAITFGDH
jgi:hypothetical protein